MPKNTTSNIMKSAAPENKRDKEAVCIRQRKPAQKVYSMRRKYGKEPLLSAGIADNAVAGTVAVHTTVIATGLDDNGYPAITRNRRRFPLIPVRKQKGNPLLS